MTSGVRCQLDVSMQKGKRTLARTYIQAFDMASSDMPSPAAADQSTQSGGDERGRPRPAGDHAPTQRPHAKPLIPHAIRRHTTEKWVNRHFCPFSTSPQNLIRDIIVD